MLYNNLFTYKNNAIIIIKLGDKGKLFNKLIIIISFALTTVVNILILSDVIKCFINASFP